MVAEAVALGCDLSTFCPAHPIAGRERAGAVSAQVDLFRDRTWALCPTSETAPDGPSPRRRRSRELCGALSRRWTPDRHDELMARLSHLPQVVASALAGLAAALGDGDLALAGRACATRPGSPTATLAVGVDPGRQPHSGRRPYRSAGRRVEPLSPTLRAGRSGDVAPRCALARRRGSGAPAVPAKVGQPTPDWSWVGVVVPDRPGELTAAVRRDRRVGHQRRGRPGRAQPRGAAR